MKTSHLLLAIALVALDFSVTGAAPRSGQIVFSSNRTGAWRICTVQADGSHLKQLTQSDSDDQDVDPMFSPDGQSVLFTSTRGGKAGIWRMEAGSTGASPDGSGVAPGTKQGQAAAKLSSAVPVGTPERICDGDQAEWSPDGTKIVFRLQERIFTRDLSSGQEKPLTPEDWPHCSAPAWSPDGKTIAFAARWDAGNAIYLVPAKGGQPVKVYDKQGACEPHWSPDGARLVYETETHICMIDPDGTKNRLITYFGGVQRYARFSPDGKWLVFCQGVSEQGPWELYVIPATGGSPQKLTEGGSDMYPDWK